MRLYFTTSKSSKMISDIVDEQDQVVYRLSKPRMSHTVTMSRHDHFGRDYIVANIRVRLYGSDEISLMSTGVGLRQEKNSRTVKAKEVLKKEKVFSKKRVFTASSGRTYLWIPEKGSWMLQRADGTDIGQANIPRDSRREKKARISDVEFESDRQTEHDMDELMTIVVYLMLREMKRRKAGKRAEGLGLVGDVLGMVGP